MQARILPKNVSISRLIGLIVLAIICFFFLSTCMAVRQRAYDIQFSCNYFYYSTSAAEATIHYARQPGHMGLSLGLMLLTAIGVVFYLYSRKNYSLAKLLIGSLLIGAAGVGGVFMDEARTTFGIFNVQFEGAVPKKEFQELTQRLKLDPAQPSTMLPSEMEVRKVADHLRISMRSEGGGVWINLQFPTGQALEERARLGKLYQAFLEDALNQFAESHQFMPLEEKNKKYEEGGIEH